MSREGHFVTRVSISLAKKVGTQRFTGVKKILNSCFEKRVSLLWYVVLTAMALIYVFKISELLPMERKKYI